MGKQVIAKEEFSAQQMHDWLWGPPGYKYMVHQHVVYCRISDSEFTALPYINAGTFHRLQGGWYYTDGRTVLDKRCGTVLANGADFEFLGGNYLISYYTDNLNVYCKARVLPNVHPADFELLSDYSAKAGDKKFEQCYES